MPLNSLIELVENTTIRAGPVFGMEVVLVIGTAAKVIRRQVLPLIEEAAETCWRVLIQWEHDKAEYFRVVRSYENATVKPDQQELGVSERLETAPQKFGPRSESCDNAARKETPGFPS
jgi:hypothetical protein